MSTDSTKKTIEKNAHGDYEFTPYGEFLSYFHAHLEIFKRFYKSKNISESKMGQDIPKLKSYMATHVKNVDQYFPNIPKFAEIMGVSKDQLSEFLNQNFLDVLPTVQEKFKKAEIKKLESSPDREFERVTEEIIEKTGFSFPEGKVFRSQGLLVVLEDPKTGEIIEPQGLMAGISAPPPAVIGADPKVQTKPVAVKVIPDNPLLEEIAGIYESDNSTNKLVAVNEKEEDSQQEAKVEINASQEDILEDIEDLDFEEPEEDSTSMDGVLDDLGDILDLGDSPSETKIDPIAPKVKNFKLVDFLEVLKTIQSFQAKKDASGYQSWLASSDDVVKSAVAIRNHHLKETKGEEIPWNEILSQMETKVDVNRESLDYLKINVVNYNWVRIGLDKGMAELRKGSPDLIEMLKKAWPHLQASFYDIPDFEGVMNNLKIIIAKIPDPNHKKEIGRVMNLVLNFLKAKIPTS